MCPNFGNPKMGGFLCGFPYATTFAHAESVWQTSDDLEVSFLLVALWLSPPESGHPSLFPVISC